MASKPALPGVVDRCSPSLDAVEPSADPCPILLENAAGAGDTVGRSFEELAEVIDAAGGDERLGVCLDTQHLWASGIPFGTLDEADRLVDLVDETVGLDRLRCLHLNDSKVAFGANRDRHENIGDGTIGPDGLAALLGHPALQGLPAILEVPGEGDGPRADDVTGRPGGVVGGSGHALLTGNNLVRMGDWWQGLGRHGAAPLPQGRRFTLGSPRTVVGIPTEPAD